MNQGTKPKRILHESKIEAAGISGAARLLVSTAAQAATTLTVKSDHLLDEGARAASLTVAGGQPGVTAPMDAVPTGVSMSFSGRFTGPTTFGTTSLTAANFAFCGGVSTISRDFDFVGAQSTTHSSDGSNQIPTFRRQWDGDVVYGFETPGDGVIPLSAAGWLLLSGLGGLVGPGWMRRRA